MNNANEKTRLIVNVISNCGTMGEWPFPAPIVKTTFLGSDDIVISKFEFESCVNELSKASWILTQTKPKQGDNVRIEYKHPMATSNQFATATYQFETDIEICVIDNDGHGMFIDKENFIAYHPLKSALDAAKEKQVESCIHVIQACQVKHKNWYVKSLIKLLQDNDMLAEIIMPLAK